MKKPKRKQVTMLVTVSVPEGLSARYARDEVRATLQGFDGNRTFYSWKGMSRSIEDDGGVCVRSVTCLPQSNTLGEQP
jgi:hypothetical protein